MSLSEIVVSYDLPKGGRGGWRHATITHGKVRLAKPSFWIESNDQEEEHII